MLPYNTRMWFRRTILALPLLVLVASIPALIAPYISKSPVDWAYRAYHPGLYRYPVRTSAELRDAHHRLQARPRWEQSLARVGLMMEHW